MSHRRPSPEFHSTIAIVFVADRQKREAARAKRQGEESKREIEDEQGLAECEEQARRDADADERVKYEAALVVRIAMRFGSSGAWLRVAEARARGAAIPLDPRRVYLLAHPDKCPLVEASDATAILNAQRPPEMTEVSVGSTSGGGGGRTRSSFIVLAGGSAGASRSLMSCDSSLSRDELRRKYVSLTFAGVSRAGGRLSRAIAATRLRPSPRAARGRPRCRGLRPPRAPRPWRFADSEVTRRERELDPRLVTAPHAAVEGPYARVCMGSRAGCALSGVGRARARELLAWRAAHVCAR